MSCANCLHCKRIPKTFTLHCTMSQWVYGNGEERRITLMGREVDYGRIDNRKYFEQAKDCSGFHPMD